MAAPGLFTKTERVSSCKSLVCLLQALAGRSSTIELRNELVVRGTITMVDSNMNTTLTKATLTKLNGDSTYYAELFIHGNQIRYVHFPESLDVTTVLENQVTTLLGGGAVGTQLRRKRLSRAKLKRQLEEKAAVRAHLLGKGRAKKSSGETAVHNKYPNH